jgi:hypothetical protein
MHARLPCSLGGQRSAWGTIHRVILMDASPGPAQGLEVPVAAALLSFRVSLAIPITVAVKVPPAARRSAGAGSVAVEELRGDV